MKCIGMPMGMWMLFAGSFRRQLTAALCRLDYTMSEAGGAVDFVRACTIASGDPYCDWGYHRKRA